MNSFIGKKNDNVQTPSLLFQELHSEFNFDCDPCPIDFTVDGLTSEWGQRNFVNPPFSTVKDWLDKALIEFDKGKLSVFLIVARTSTSFWYTHIFPYATEIRFINQTIKFEGYTKYFPIPCCLIIFDPSRARNNITSTVDSSYRITSVNL